MDGNLRGVLIAAFSAIVGALIGSATSGYLASQTAKQNLYSEASFKLSADLKQKSAAYYRATERLSALNNYGELSRSNIVLALKALDEAIADLTPLFTTDMYPSFRAVLDGNRALYLEEPEWGDDMSRKLTDGTLNIDIAIHAYIDNYDTVARTSLAGMDNWMVRKNQVYNRMLRPMLRTDELDMEYINKILHPAH